MRERERESARAREEKRRTRSRRRKIAPLIAISPSRDHAGSRSRSTAREEDPRSRSTLREIAPSIAISDRTVDRDLAKKARSRSRRQSQSRIAINSVVVGLDLLGCGLCFSGFVFSFFFSKHQKIFSGKFFEMQPNTWKYFPFPEIRIFGKYLFSGKRFTATKHSLKG